MSFRTARLDWLEGLGIAIVSAIALNSNLTRKIPPSGSLSSE
ncbi:hypothetical protein [Nostoc sp.]